jgi:hypothetical protein
MNGKINLSRPRKFDTFSPFFGLRRTVHCVTRFTAQDIRLTLFYSNQEIVDREVQFQQREIGLQAQS